MLALVYAWAGMPCEVLTLITTYSLIGMVLGLVAITRAAKGILFFGAIPATVPMVFFGLLWEIALATWPQWHQLDHSNAWVLAHAHATTGDAAAIDAYLGKGQAFGVAMARFASAYAVQDPARPHRTHRRHPRQRDRQRARLVTPNPYLRQAASTPPAIARCGGRCEGLFVGVRRAIAAIAATATCGMAWACTPPPPPPDQLDVNRPGFGGGSGYWIPTPIGVGLLGSVERCFELGGRDVAEVAVEAAGVVPVDPAEGGQLDVFDGLPRSRWAGPADQLGLVEPVDGLGQGVVVGVADACRSTGRRRSRRGVRRSGRW